MRHRVYGKHFGRNKNQRQALFKGLVQSLLSYGTIQTSEAKAKAIKGLVDKIINSVRKDSYKADKEIGQRVKEILPKLGSRTSGYTSMIRIGAREGDQAVLVKMSLIGAEQLEPKEKAKKSPSEEKPKTKEVKTPKTEKKQKPLKKTATKAKGKKAGRKEGKINVYK